jgi:hypothetical protein
MTAPVVFGDVINLRGGWNPCPLESGFGAKGGLDPLPNEIVGGNPTVLIFIRAAKANLRGAGRFACDRRPGTGARQGFASLSPLQINTGHFLSRMRSGARTAPAPRRISARCCSWSGEEGGTGKPVVFVKPGAPAPARTRPGSCQPPLGRLRVRSSRDSPLRSL